LRVIRANQPFQVLRSPRQISGDQRRERGLQPEQRMVPVLTGQAEKQHELDQQQNRQHKEIDHPQGKAGPDGKTAGQADDASGSAQPAAGAGARQFRSLRPHARRGSRRQIKTMACVSRRAGQAGPPAAPKKEPNGEPGKNRTDRAYSQAGGKRSAGLPVRVRSSMVEILFSLCFAGKQVGRLAVQDLA
jgi:hypothetical protein